MSLPIPIHFQDFISNMKGLRLTAAAAVASGSLGLLLGTSFDPVNPSGSPKPAAVLAEEEKKIEEVSIKLPPTPPSFKLVEREVRKPKWDSFRAGTVHSGIKAWEYNWDCLHFDAIPNQVEADKAEEESVPFKRRPTASRHLILVRHGQYNLEGKNDDEKILTQMGIDQANFTGVRLAQLNLPLTYMVSSNMSRAKQTAGVIGQHLPDGLLVLPDDPILREGAPYPPEPGSVKAEWPYHIDGARIEAAFRKYFHRADREQDEDTFELIVCHANVIRYFVCRALQLPPEAWLRISLKHASITWVTIRPDGRCSLRTLGEASHIPPQYLSTTREVLPY